MRIGAAYPNFRALARRGAIYPGPMRHLYADFIDRVAKPMRYLGGEYQSGLVKAEAEARVCLAFPDKSRHRDVRTWRTKIIYSLLNKDPRIACERAFAPWVDMEGELRARNLPLVSLETQRALHEFDVLGISLQYELTFTNMLTLLDLGGIPLRAVDRRRGRDARARLDPGESPEPVLRSSAAFIGGAEALLGEVDDHARGRRCARGSARVR